MAGVLPRLSALVWDLLSLALTFGAAFCLDLIVRFLRTL
jgi:hypothetical protein